MRNWLLLLIATLPSLGWTQKEYPVRPFEDYNNCASGFINSMGDTIWPAIFSQVKHPMSPDYINSTCWSATRDGKIGLLSENGELLLPFEFSLLEMTPKIDVFIAEKNGFIGIIDRRGKEIYPFKMKGCTLIEKGDFLFQEEKLGVLDSDFRVKIKPEYDEIEFVNNNDYNDGLDYYSGEDFYLLRKGDYFGLARHDGTVLFDDGKYPFTFMNMPDASKTTLLAIYDQDRVGLTSIRNELILEPKFTDLQLFRLLNAAGDTVNMVLTELNYDGHQKQVINLKTKQVSKVYEDILIGTHELIYRDGRKNGILSSDLVEIQVKSPYELRFRPHLSYYSESEYGEGKIYPFQVNSTKNNVLMLAQVKRGKKTGFEQVQGFGLYDFQSGKSVKPQYKTIFYKAYRGENYYFAIKPFADNLDSGYVVVYDNDLNKLGKFMVNNLTANNFFEFFNSKKQRDSVLILQNHENKKGAIYPNGAIAIPFIYDHLYPYYEQGQYENTIKLNASIGNLNGYVTWGGKELVPVRYAYIETFLNGFTIAGNPGDYSLFDNNNQPIISNFDFIAGGSTRNLKGFYGFDSEFERNFTFFAAKDGYVYAYFPKVGFKLLNQDHYQFDKRFDYVMINYQFVADSSGKCYLYSDFVNRFSAEVYSFNKRDTVCFFHVKKGIVAEVPRAQLKDFEDDYIHVYQDRKGEGLISKSTGEWVLPVSSYSRIITEKKNKFHLNQDNFWYVIKEDEKATSNMWTYYRADSKTVLERKFDIPQFEIHGQFMIARSGGAFGILDSTFQVVVPFEYRNIFFSEGSFFLKGTDRLWYLWTVQQGIVPLKCKDVSLAAFTNGRLIFDDQLVGVISLDGEVLVSLTQVSNLTRGKSLTALLGKPIYHPNNLNWAQRLLSKEDSLGRMLNNFVVIDQSLINSTRHQMVELVAFQFINQELTPYFVDPIYLLRQESITFDFKGEYFSSFTQVKKNLLFNEYLRYSQRDYLANVRSETVHTTVMLDGSGYRIAQLSDLFKPEFNYRAFLDQRLAEIIQEKQLFGLTCLNLPQILDEYKANFRLVQTGLQFSLKDDTKAIILPWIEVKSHLKAL